MIRGTFTLLRLSLRRMRAVLVASFAMLALFQVLITLLARELDRSGTFTGLGGMIPEFVRPILDPSFTAAISFRGMSTFGFAHLVVIGYLTALAIAAGSEPVGEVELRVVDLLLSRPLARAVILARSIAVVLVVAFGGVGSLTAGLVLALAALAPARAEAPPLGMVLALAANLALLTVAWGTVALAAASAVKRRSTAAGIAGLAAFASFLLDYLGRAWEAARPFAKVSLYHYYSPFPILAGQPVPTVDAAVLGAVAAVAVAIAFWCYQTRDL